MTLAALALAYVIGGFTLVPLLLATVAFAAWKLSPHDAPKEDELKAPVPEEDFDGDIAAASGTFAVLRTFSFPAANAALNARNAALSNASADGDAEATTGESVYQSMYRSVFDRSKQAAKKSVLKGEDESAAAGTSAPAKKTSVPVNVFYIVLRHGHLILYDSAAQSEVRHVISMARYTVSLSADSDTDVDQDMRDGELFIKRTAIILTPIEAPLRQPEVGIPSSKPFYLFSSTCTEKEDFYHALLYTRAQPPKPMPLDSADTIKLQSALHSTSLTPETRALNGLIGRVFLALHRTESLRNLVQRKIEKKISRVQKPAFIASLAVHAIDLGDAAPVFSNLRLADFTVEGDMTVALDVRYDGSPKAVDSTTKQSSGLKLTISAMAKLDLGPRFKTRTVDLLLATSLRRLQGRLLLRIKPPPSNRIWFCFENVPEMDVHVEPVVSQRQITYTFVLRAIEERIRAVVSETIVKPNWDDIPFFDTRSQRVRGGIWADEGREPEEEKAKEQLASLGSKHARANSTPQLVGESESSSGSEARTSGSLLPSRNALEDLKRRSVASLPVRPSTPSSKATYSKLDSRVEGSDHASLSPSPIRSPSFPIRAATTAPVAVHDANVEQVRRADTSSQQSQGWRAKAPALPPRKEAVEAMREMRDKVTLLAEKKFDLRTDSTDHLHKQGSSHPPSGTDTDDDRLSLSRRSSDPPSPASGTASFLNAGSLRSPTRTDTISSTSSASSTAQQKKTILAATAAATTAARNWSINALANARNARSPAAPTHVRRVSAGPMGRGQPLPPPGTPLPGPQRTSLFAGLSVKRKPVPAAQSDPDVPATEDLQGQDESLQPSVEPSSDKKVDREHEFGPWRSNSGGAELLDSGSSQVVGTALHAHAGSSVDHDPADPPLVEKSQPTKPPLPVRRRQASDSVDAVAAQQVSDAELVHSSPVAVATETKLDHGEISSLESIGDDDDDDDDDGSVVAIPAPVDDDETDDAQDMVPEMQRSIFDDNGPHSTSVEEELKHD